jgi:molybdopterin synthase catalytic subunit
MAYVGIHKKGQFSFFDLIATIKAREDFNKAGAISTFIGIVRGETLNGEDVEKMELQAYEGEANKVLDNICNDLKSKDGIVDVQIHHFVGEFEVGEDLVYVVVAGAHREEVFSVLQEAVERYKSETPVFKKEHIVDDKGVKESYWVSERKVQRKRKKKMS